MLIRQRSTPCLYPSTFAHNFCCGVSDPSLRFRHLPARILQPSSHILSIKPRPHAFQHSFHLPAYLAPAPRDARPCHSKSVAKCCFLRGPAVPAQRACSGRRPVDSVGRANLPRSGCLGSHPPGCSGYTSSSYLWHSSAWWRRLTLPAAHLRDLASCSCRAHATTELELVASGESLQFFRALLIPLVDSSYDRSLSPLEGATRPRRSRISQN